MANFNPSPNMNLPIPTVSVDPGPDYANNLNSSLTVIDQHNHSSGNGVLINPDGMNINSTLTFNSNSATNLAFANFTPQGGSVPAPVNYSIYVLPASGSSSGDLYYQDGNSDPIQLTKNGGPNAGVGNIGGLPSTPDGGAGISWINSQNTFQLTQDSGDPGGNIDCGAVVVRYPGSYPNPSGNYIALAAPSGLVSQTFHYLPTTNPGLSNGFWVENTSGGIFFVYPDTTTIEVAGTPGMIQVVPGGITATQIANGTITTTQISSTANIIGTQLAANTLTGSEITTGNLSLAGSLSLNGTSAGGHLVQGSTPDTLFLAHPDNTNARPIIIGPTVEAQTGYLLGLLILTISGSTPTINYGSSWGSITGTNPNFHFVFANALATTAGVIVGAITAGATPPTISASSSTSISFTSNGNGTFTFIILGERGTTW